MWHCSAWLFWIWSCWLSVNPSIQSVFVRLNRWLITLSGHWPGVHCCSTPDGCIVFVVFHTNTQYLQWSIGCSRRPKLLKGGCKQRTKRASDFWGILVKEGPGWLRDTWKLGWHENFEKPRNNWKGSQTTDFTICCSSFWREQGLCFI